jgi:hypothetical protein
MSIFNRLFRKKAVHSVDDPVFGRITFDHGIWSFIPSSTGGDYMITVVAPESGPSDEQRIFFGRIRPQVADFEERARAFIQSETTGEVDVSILSTYGIDIGDSAETEDGRFTLELSDPNAWVIHRVEFCGDSPILYGFDD